jgi:hypothetical protein
LPGLGFYHCRIQVSPRPSSRPRSRSRCRAEAEFTSGEGVAVTTYADFAALAYAMAAERAGLVAKGAAVAGFVMPR